MGAVSEAIRSKLENAFRPTVLEVIDESARHAGHAGSRPGGESHFDVRITAEAFSGLGRVQRQRRVLSVLADELKGPVHALSVRARAPGEPD